jgi:hypothetical protein
MELWFPVKIPTRISVQICHRATKDTVNESTALRLSSFDFNSLTASLPMILSRIFQCQLRFSSYYFQLWLLTSIPSQPMTPRNNCWSRLRLVPLKDGSLGKLRSIAATKLNQLSLTISKSLPPAPILIRNTSVKWLENAAIGLKSVWYVCSWEGAVKSGFTCAPCDWNFGLAKKS